MLIVWMDPQMEVSNKKMFKKKMFLKKKIYPDNYRFL